MEVLSLLCVTQPGFLIQYLPFFNLKHVLSYSSQISRSEPWMRLGMAEGPKWQSEAGGDVKWEDRDYGEYISHLYATFALRAKSFQFSLGLVLVSFGLDFYQQ